MIWNSNVPSLGQIKKFVAAANYLAVAQIYLKDNFLLYYYYGLRAYQA